MFSGRSTSPNSGACPRVQTARYATAANRWPVRQFQSEVLRVLPNPENILFFRQWSLRMFQKTSLIGGLSAKARSSSVKVRQPSRWRRNGHPPPESVSRQLLKYSEYLKDARIRRPKRPALRACAA